VPTWNNLADIVCLAGTELWIGAGCLHVYCVQAELTDREFEKLLAQEEKQKVEEKKKKSKQTKRESRGGPRSRILNRKSDRRNKVAMNDSKSDESGDGDQVKFVAAIVKCYVLSLMLITLQNF